MPFVSDNDVDSSHHQEQSELISLNEDMRRLAQPCSGDDGVPDRFNQASNASAASVAEESKHEPFMTYE